MADPITALGAIGILSNFMQIADFTAGVVTKTREVLKSGSDAFRENIEIERLARECGWLGEWIQETSKKQQPLEKDETAVFAAARQCVLESERLLDMLKGLKLSEGSQGIRRTFQGAHRAVRAVRKREDVAAHQKMLDSLNGQLAVALLQVLRYVHTASDAAAFRRIDKSHRRKQVGFHEEVLSNMESHAENSLATVLNSKIEIMEALRRQEASSSSTMHSQQLMLSRLCSNLDESDRAKSTSNALKEARMRFVVADSLRFPDMRLRKDAIPLTYQNTFNWIFDERHNFRSWLELEDGIFWISGKAGSGKSTLMKFISDHALTHSMLKAWAAPHQPHSLDFYFWYTGSELQKSQEGLLRSILYDLFGKCPDLLPKVVPQRWHCADYFHKTPDTWSRAELSLVLQSIAAMSNLNYRFCLFLDGLDEFSGNHRDLIADLRLLCTNKCIKLCVSSRTWNVFVNAFGSLDTVLHLEELNADDIEKYAAGHLAGTGRRQSTPEVNDLVSEIVLKSQGVFFWVFLVVRSLATGFDEGDSIKILQRRLSEIPSDLETFFKSILDRLDQIYRSETSQVLKLAMLALGRRRISSVLAGIRHSWLDFWLLREFDLSDSDWAAKVEIKFCDVFRTRQMCANTRSFINATCKDFLCFGVDGDVQFLHQSVYDFLSGPTIQALIDDRVPPVLRDPLVLLHIRLARCKLLQGSRSHPGVNDNFGRRIYQDTLKDSEQGALVFPGSSRMAKAFEDALAALLETCGGDVDGVHDWKCVFNQDWKVLLSFLIANGSYDLVLKVTEKHQVEQIGSFMWTAKRHPRQSLCKEDGNKQKRVPESTEQVFSNLSSDEFIEKLRARHPSQGPFK